MARNKIDKIYDFDSSESQSSSEKGIQDIRQSKSVSYLGNIQAQLKACKGESGFFNPEQAFSKLNEIQKAEDPKAYEPELQ